MKIVLLLSFFITTLFSQATLVLTPQEQEFIKTHPRIVLGTEKKWKPYVIVSESGEISGYDKDVLDLINKVSGANFTLKAGDWKQMQLDARAKKVDGLSTGGIHEERKEYLNFSNIYITMQKMVVVTKKNPKNINNIADLDYKTIAIHKSNLVDEKIARQFTKSKIIRLENLEETFEYLITGKADATFGNGSSMYLANLIGLPPLKYVAKLDSSLELAFGVRKDWSQAIGIINKSLEYIGEHKLLEIKNKWFFSSVAQEKDRFTQEELDYIKAKKELNICVQKDLMPYARFVNGRYEGVDADLFKIVQKKLAISIHYKLYKPKMKGCDIVSLLKDKKNQNDYRTTLAYLEPSYVFVTNDDKKSILNIGFLEGAKVALLGTASVGESFKLKYPNLEIIVLDDVKQASQMLQDDEIDGVVDDIYNVQYHFQNGDYVEAKIGGYFKEKSFYFYGIAEGDKELYSIMNKVIKNFSAEDKQAVLSKWLSFNKEEFDYEVFYQIVIFLSVVIMLIVLKQLSVQKLNKELKIRVDEELEKSQDKDKMLYHQSKHIAMGEMMENIAHQWRQPLAQINSSVLVIDDILDENKTMTQEIDTKLIEIEQLTKYLSDTIEDFRNFFSENKLKVTVNIKTIVNRSVYIVSGSLKQNKIDITLDISDELLYNGYINELQQVLVVLLNNAKDVLVEKKIADAKIKIIVDDMENKFSIKILDNGGGIKVDIIDKIFEPYFTTKHQTQGTGLGLYISKKIVEESLEGEFTVKNTHEGACFEIILYKR